MFGLFNKPQEEKWPEWHAELQESRQRWFAFLDKLEIKMEELCMASIPELKEMLATDDDIYKRAFQRVYAGVNGQLDHIREKARDTFEEKISDVYATLSAGVSVLHPHHDLLDDFRNSCGDRYHREFEEKYQHWRNQLEKTQERDLEVEYEKILSEFEAIKNKFHCKQCGGNITIEKLFFMETYISCPHCQTQNTFEPGTQARMLQNFARGLAEQRTAHLLEAYEAANNAERDLYHERHTLSLSTIHEKDKKVLAQKQAQMDALESQRQEAIASAPVLYRTYLRAMYDEWNKITPDLKEHNEKMYENQLQSI
jgi:RNA polymerase-binding transcription factor DksA